MNSTKIKRFDFKKGEHCFSFYYSDPKELINHLVDIADIDDFLPSHKSTPCFMVLIEQASEPVQTLWSLVNYPPPELIEDINNDDPAASWDALQRYLNYSMKWSWEQMHSAMKELREICST